MYTLIARIVAARASGASRARNAQVMRAGAALLLAQLLHRLLAPAVRSDA